MKKIRILLVIVLVLAGLALSSWREWKISFLKDKNDYLLAEKEQLETEKEQLETEKEQLETENKKIKAENKKLKKVIEMKDEDSMYKKVLNDIFWRHGKYIPPKDAMFYSNPGCNTPIFCNEFITNIWIFYQRFNNYEVYTYWSTKGFVYSPHQISFEKK